MDNNYMENSLSGLVGDINTQPPAVESRSFSAAQLNEQREKLKQDFFGNTEDYKNRANYPSDEVNYTTQKKTYYDYETKEEVTEIIPTMDGLMIFAEDIMGPYGGRWRVSILGYGTVVTKNVINAQFVYTPNTAIAIDFPFSVSCPGSSLFKVNEVAIREALKLMGFARNLRTKTTRVKAVPPVKEYKTASNFIVPEDAGPSNKTAAQPTAKASGQKREFDFIKCKDIKNLINDATKSFNDVKSAVDTELAKKMDPKWENWYKKEFDKILMEAASVRGTTYTSVYQAPVEQQPENQVEEIDDNIPF